MASQFQEPVGSAIHRARVKAALTAGRPCGYAGFWMGIMIWASRHCAR